jgi:hypothetical protein
MEATAHRFPTLAARDMIASLKLIDGDAVWGDQRKIELRTSGCRNGRTIGPHTAMFKEL